MSWNGNNQKITCSLVENPNVTIGLKVQDKVNLLLKEYPGQEWLGYLTGRIKSNNIYCEDLVIPPHEEANGGSCTAEPFHQPSNVVGVLHSHHSMGAFHSATDQTHVDANFPVSITVSKSGSSIEYDSVSVTKTPCGKPISIGANTKFESVKPTFNVKEWLENAKNNIDRGKKVFIIGDGTLSSEDIKALYRQFNNVDV